MLVTPSASEMINSMVFGIQQPRHLNQQQSAQMSQYMFETIKTIYFFIFGFMMEFMSQVITGVADGFRRISILETAQPQQTNQAAAFMPFLSMPGIQLTNVT